MIMKLFSLEEYIANPSLHVRLRNGRPVRIVCTDANNQYPIILLIKKQDGTEEAKRYPKSGKCGYSPYDLVFD